MSNTAGLEVRETGRVLRVQTETPHLVSTGSGRLSVAVTLHPLPEGKNRTIFPFCLFFFFFSSSIIATLS